MSDVEHRFTVPAELAGLRLDQCLNESVPGLSRRRARRLIEAGAVLVAGKRICVLSRRVERGMEIVCHLLPELAGSRPALDDDRLLHVDEALVVIDKPAGIATHATRSHLEGTAIQLTEENLRRRQGRKIALWALNRLDTGTSGVVLFARSREDARTVHRQFAAREVGKRYLAVVGGRPEASEGTIELAIRAEHLRSVIDPAEGKPSVTRYRVLGSGGGRSLLDVTPETGRMHQIRVHLAAIGTPVVGDAKYGGTEAARLMLHARGTRLLHPTRGTPFEIDAGVPAEFSGFEVAAEPGDPPCPTP